MKNLWHKNWDPHETNLSGINVAQCHVGSVISITTAYFRDSKKPLSKIIHISVKKCYLLITYQILNFCKHNKGRF